MSMSQDNQQDKEKNTRKILIICCSALGILAVVFVLLILGIYATDSGSQKAKEKVKEEIEEEVDEIEEEQGEEAEGKLKDIAKDVDEESLDKAKDKAKDIFDGIEDGDGTAGEAKEATLEEPEDDHRYTGPHLRDQMEEDSSKGNSVEDPTGRTKKPAGEVPAEDATAGETAPAEETEQAGQAETATEYVWRGDSSKDFTVTLASGSTFTLSEQAGKVVLVNFWTTWCGPCCREMPAFEKLYGDYGNSGDVRIVAIDCGESTSTVNSFISSNGYTFPIGYDTDGSISSKYSVSSIPYTVIFNKDGTVYTDYVGAADADTQYREYKNAIEGALANQ